MYILAVEDDVAIREAICEVLDYAGYKVASAANGQDALDFLEKQEKKPGLILLDLMMPVMDGWVFVEEALKNPALASIPIVVVSAVASEHQLKNQPNVKELIKKPIVIEHLLKTVRNVCGSPSP